MTKFMTVDGIGLPTGFYAEDVHGSRLRPILQIKAPQEDEPSDHAPEYEVVGYEPNPDCLIPTDAIEISEDQWHEFLSNPVRRRWSNGAVVPYEPEPEPLTLADYKSAFDAYLDEVAQQRRYDNRVTIGTYATSSNPVYAAEAQAFILWRDQALASMFEQLAAVEAGAPAPSIETFLQNLPLIAWPA